MVLTFDQGSLTKFSCENSGVFLNPNKNHQPKVQRQQKSRNGQQLFPSFTLAIVEGEAEEL